MPTFFKTEIDVDLLRAAISYDPETGLFTWRDTPRRRAFSGKIAGRLGNRGYVDICFNRQHWLAHRLAWVMVYGSLPEPPLELDHINRNCADNRLCNLRVVTRVENNANRDSSASNVRGSTFRAFRSGRWQAQIGANKTTKYLGTFDTEAEARQAYIAAAHAVGCTIEAA